MSHGNIQVPASEAQFDEILGAAGNKLVVVDWFATNLIQVFVQLSEEHPEVVFVKVDTDKLKPLSTKHGSTWLNINPTVQAMPTFHFLRNSQKIDELVGANPNVLAAKVLQHKGTGGGEAAGTPLLQDIEDVSYQGHSNLYPHIQTIEILNQSPEHDKVNLFRKTAAYLQSDCDAQLIINLAFKQAVKIHSFKIKAPEAEGPRTLRLYVNRTISFEDTSKPVQEIVLTPEQLSGEVWVPLKFVSFQNVQQLTLFVVDNQASADTTIIEYLCLVGSRK